MDDITRFTCAAEEDGADAFDGMQEDAAGPWVYYSDYVALRAKLVALVELWLAEAPHSTYARELREVMG